jgi:hypothetical protein
MTEHRDITINHLQKHIEDIVYIFMHTIVKFRVVIWFSFIVMHITNKQHNCATTSTPLFRLVVAFLWPFPLLLATQTCSISHQFNAAVGCCVVLPLISHQPSINYNWTCWCVVPSSSFSSPIAPIAAPSTLRIRKQVDCYVIEVLLVQQQLHLVPCTSFVHKSAEVHHLCTAIRPFQWFWWQNRLLLHNRRRRKKPPRA